ncbi:hypothetical protein XENORESO_012813 [Xenotaenia resolanae]|uniref:Transposase n=1 Tax=Xenotaenia resolanae TaxID=208358 RepID=A0ABV0VZU5_9TELE
MQPYSHRLHGKQKHAAIINLHLNDLATGKKPAAKLCLDHQELQAKRFNCSVEGLRTLRRIHQAAGMSPVATSAELVQNVQQPDCGHLLKQYVKSLGQKQQQEASWGNILQDVHSWRAEDLCKVIFSDESSLIVWDESCVEPAVQHPDIIHVWGCFSSR